METPEILAAHRRTLERLVPLLDAIRSVAEIAWRRSERGATPLERYRAEVRAMLEPLLAGLDTRQREAVLGRGEGPLGVLFITTERGLCGPFNTRLVREGLAQLSHLAWHGRPVRLLCLGSRGRRVLEASGHELLYGRPLPSLSVPSYSEIEAVVLDLLDLVDGGAIRQLWVIHNAPLRRFQYVAVTRRVLPIDMEVAVRRGARVKPAADSPRLLTHLLSEELLAALYQAVLEPATSEHLARMYTMRLASDNCRRLVDGLTAEYNAARRNAITGALMEVVAGYEATGPRGER